MAELKKILITLPDNLLKEIDHLVSVEKTNRSEFVREAMKLYLQDGDESALPDDEVPDFG